MTLRRDTDVPPARPEGDGLAAPACRARRGEFAQSPCPRDVRGARSSQMTSEPRTVPDVLLALTSTPWRMLGRRWNYKSAVLSSLTRASLFFCVNLTAGLDGASAAAATELVFRLTTSGFYGALTQSFRHVEPRWQGQLAALLIVPAVCHTLEFLVHWLRGTPELAASLGASMAFTALSTAFHLFAMQRGVLIVGEGRQTLWQDLRALPGVVAAFVRQAAQTAVRACL